GRDDAAGSLRGSWHKYEPVLGHRYEPHPLLIGKARKCVRKQARGLPVKQVRFEESKKVSKQGFRLRRQPFGLGNILTRKTRLSFPVDGTGNRVIEILSTRRVARSASLLHCARSFQNRC